MRRASWAGCVTEYRWPWREVMATSGRAPLRFCRWLLNCLLAFAPALALAMGAEPAPATSAAQRLDQAWTVTTAYRPAEGDPTAAETLSVLPAPSAPGVWRPQALPLVHPRDVRSPPDDAAMVVDWYRLSLPAPPPGAAPQALYAPRVSGGAVMVAGHVGGEWRLLWDGRDQRVGQWNRPLWVELAALPAGETRRELAIALVHYPGEGHRLTRVYVGPRDELSWSLYWRRLLQLAAPQVSSLSFVSLGLLAFLFWLGRRRSEPAYLWFALSSVVWLLRNLHYHMDMPRDETTLTWFLWATNVSLSWVMVLVYLFAFRFDDRRYPWVERCLLLFVLAMSVLTMPVPGLLSGNLLVQHIINATVALLVTGWMSVLAWRGGGRAFRLITLSLVVSMGFGLHDLLLVAGRLSPEAVYLMPFATFLLFLSFLYAVQQRFAQAIDEVERTNLRLEQRLAEREAELRANHERLRSVEREQALLLERQRLVRDMHDGLGSTLMSSLVLVQQGQLDSSAVAELLRECVDDLRLVIDSLEPIGQDLVTLMASLRHRLGRRLEAAGLTLEWEVEDVPPLPWLQPPDALQVLRIVQEVLTNILKHAQAKRVHIATRATEGGVQVLVEDDGVGFDTGQPASGRGLRHLAQRSARLGGRLTVQSQPGQGTRVQLDLPLERAAPT